MFWAACGLAVIAVLSVFAITGRLPASNPITLVLLYFDMFLSAVLLGSPDLTISSRCGLALLGRRIGPAWLDGLLRFIGRCLNAITAGKHCGQAIVHDIRRAQRAITILEGRR